MRLSEKEYQLLLSKAGNDLETKTKKGDKANTSAYIRKCIFLQEDRPVRLEKELKNLSYQVRKIGVNINQVVAKINAGYGNQIDIYNLEKALEQIKHEMKTLNEKVEDYGDH
nr:plasmid mobilization relaxosome protein MobC [Anaerobutyricum hallii]